MYCMQLPAKLSGVSLRFSLLAQLNTQISVVFASLPTQLQRPLASNNISLSPHSLPTSYIYGFPQQ